MKKSLFGLLCALLLTVSVRAGEKSGAAAPVKDAAYDSAADSKSPLDFANTWSQNGPYSLENLKGKVVVVYFYVDT